MSAAVDDVVAAPVLFEERRCSNGSRIGLATLNAPATLNDLSLARGRICRNG